MGFSGTNPDTGSQPVVRCYGKQGTAEPWIKEGNQPVKMTRPSGRHFLF